MVLSQVLISGTAIGFIYALIALSLTIVYRATTIVNFGHGDFVMAGAFVVYVLVVIQIMNQIIQWMNVDYVMGQVWLLGI